MVFCLLLRRRDSNPRPSDYEPDELATALRRYVWKMKDSNLRGFYTHNFSKVAR